MNSRCPSGHAARANMTKKKSKQSNPAISKPAGSLQTKTPEGKKPRRTSGAIRQSNVAKGAHLIKMHPPERLLDPILFCPDREYYNLDEYPREQPGSSTWNKSYDQLANALRKGVFITHRGCMIPHYRWCTKGEGIGAGHKGYQLMASVVYGFAPTGQIPDGVTLPEGWKTAMSETKLGTADTKQPRLLNALDWDSTLQASHLCHNHQCMNPLHIVYEPAWRNRKRNYCGSKGQCDCGQSPQCLLPYAPSDKDWSEFQSQNVAVSSLEQLLFQPMRASNLKFSFERPSFLQEKDTKAAKRNERLANKKQRDAAGKAQAFQSAKKAARRVSNSLAKAECAKAGLSPEHENTIASAAETAMLKHLNPDHYLHDTTTAEDDDVPASLESE